MKKGILAITILLLATILALALVTVVLADSDAGKTKDRMNEKSMLRTANAPARMMMHKMVKADENFKIRPLVQDKVREMDDMFEKLKGNDTRLRSEFKEKSDRFSEILPRLHACNEANATNQTANMSRDCTKIRTEAIERSKAAALKAVDRILTHLEKLKAKLESSQNMPQDELNERIAKINALIVEVGKIKQKIQAADTKKEINAALKELKLLVAKVKRASEYHSQGLLRAEIWGVLQRIEVLDKKLQCALDGLKANGTNTAALDQKLVQLNVTMTQAKDKLKTAKDLLGSDNSTQIEAGKALVREARDLVQQAHTMLQDIRKEIQALGGRPCQEKQEIEIEEETPPAPPATNTTNTTNSTA